MSGTFTPTVILHPGSPPLGIPSYDMTQSDFATFIAVNRGDSPIERQEPQVSDVDEGYEDNEYVEFDELDGTIFAGIWEEYEEVLERYQDNTLSEDSADVGEHWQLGEQFDIIAPEPFIYDQEVVDLVLGKPDDTEEEDLDNAITGSSRSNSLIVQEGSDLAPTHPESSPFPFSADDWYHSPSDNVEYTQSDFIFGRLPVLHTEISPRSASTSNSDFSLVDSIDVAATPSSAQVPFRARLRQFFSRRLVRST